MLIILISGKSDSELCYDAAWQGSVLLISLLLLLGKLVGSALLADLDKNEKSLNWISYVDVGTGKEVAVINEALNSSNYYVYFWEALF